MAKPFVETIPSRFLFALVNVLAVLALPLIMLAILVRWRRRVLSQGYLHWSERWGHVPDSVAASFQGHKPCWWVHAASLGEVKAIEPFLRQAPLAAGVNVLLTVVTPEALAWARDRRIADAVIAAPIDLPWVVRRVLKVMRPQLLISVESEVWPNLLRETRRYGARVALVNGRLSARSFRSYQRFAGVTRILWSYFDLYAVRQREDAERFAGLGIPSEKIKVTGNMKYDLLVSRAQPSKSKARLSLVIGSTREGEENRLLPVIEAVRKAVPGLQVIWAPRHVERVEELEKLFQSQGLALTRKSTLSSLNGSAASVANVLWDSMGDLLDAYTRADVAIVGGSFVAKGGQNPIEPAALEIPVIFGPSMENFRGVSESLVREGGAYQVSLENLGARLQELLGDEPRRRDMGRRAKQAIQSEQGATDRTLALLKELCRA